MLERQLYLTGMFGFETKGFIQFYGLSHFSEEQVAPGIR